MEVTPKSINEAVFREKLRGYSQDDVDAFLKQVAAGVEAWQERLAQATERAAQAERQIAEAAESDETLRRTLVLAQRTADLAVREARDEASRILTEAEKARDALVADAQAGARREHERARSDLEAELARLVATRDDLVTDVAALRTYVEHTRE
ncbi:MAG: DivIVA domain-containing protein, partial [Acidimicrobiales bacterium]